jgi:hypothetical protein
MEDVMHSRGLRAAFAFAGLLLMPLLPCRLEAQGPSLEVAMARLRLAAPAEPAPAWTAPASPLLALPDTAGAKRKDHTVTGLLVGAGLGFVAGWAFFYAMCEAVDNNCSDSRFRLVAVGTGAGAALGALIGSAVD